MFNEFQAVSEAAAGLPLRVLTVCLTLDREYGPRYGDAARRRLQESRNRVNQAIRRWSKKLGMTCLLYSAGYDLHGDSALHTHMVWVFRGAKEIPEFMLQALGRSQAAGAALKRGCRRDEAGALLASKEDIWGIAREGGVQWQWDRYHCGQELACCKSAAWYALKYALKANTDWDRIEAETTFGELAQGVLRPKHHKHAYQGMRFGERGRSAYMRALRAACGWRYGRPPTGRLKARHRGGRLILIGSDMVVNELGQRIKVLDTPELWSVYSYGRWRTLANHNKLAELYARLPANNERGITVITRLSAHQRECIARREQLAQDAKGVNTR